jgi:hypothetical protein
MFIDADLADWMEQRHEVPLAEEDYPRQGAPRTHSFDAWAQQSPLFRVRNICR